LDLISLLFLTNFQLGPWVRGIWSRDSESKDETPEERALARRARDLQKQAKKLQEEVDRSGLGADLQPVPEPTVRDLSISQSKSGRAKRPKPLTVASTPLIGNYQLPPFDFLQHPDPNLKPTESKEELLANARLMQQTLAQFEIPVELGDITKGPTITRYELHPAPGVK